MKLAQRKASTMKFKSQIVTQASGSLGGTTFSRNTGGMYMRARAVPTNPNSPQQQAVRGIFADLTQRWNNSLDGLQRASWLAYAFTVPLIDKLGDSVKVTALNMYIRSNVPRVQSGLARIDDAPTTFNLGGFTNPTFGIDATANEADVAFDVADAWVGETGSSMLLWAGSPQNATINYFKGPYRYAGRIDGDATTPPTSPAAIALPYAAAVGQRVFLRVSVTRADGRLSYPFLGFGLGA